MAVTIQTISTAGDFIQYVGSLAETASEYERSLEEYLRALWALAQEHEESPVSFKLLATLLTEALTREPPPFDNHWLMYTSPPDLPYFLVETRLIKNDFEILQQMLLYQIADLHRMAEDGSLWTPYAYFGVDSPTGHRWYNFHPTDFLSCAASGLGGGWDSTDPDCNWADLANVLYVGQIYE